METEDEIRAGEFLEHLGNKKSKIVIAAINEYLLNHSEALNEVCSDKNKALGGLEGIILSLIQSNKSVPQFTANEKSISKESVRVTHDEIEKMIQDLDLFSN